MTLGLFLRLTPEFRDYVWGGDRLRPGHAPTAEAWVVWEGDRIETGELAGKTLGEAASELGASLLGERTVARTGMRFPLLIKLLDCRQWLSLQVHPNDEQAAQLEGPGQAGKTEAWHVLESQPDAKLITGLKPEVDSSMLADAIRNGTIADYVQYANVSPGDTVFMPAGTLHALGPGLLVYEVQQSSNWTYRVYDWGRPQTETRRLHIEKSIQVARASLSAPIVSLPTIKDGSRTLLVKCEYFTLELLTASVRAIELDTRAETFHALTIIEGRARLQAGDETIELEKFQTVLIPASTGKYQFQPVENCRALKSSA